MIESAYISYRPRPIAFLGLREIKGYRLKLYSIVYGDKPFQRPGFDEGLEFASSALPKPSRAAGRPGLGFAIAHQGRDCDYLVLSWWGRENELPTKVYFRGKAGWRPVREDESFCVWDLEVISFERDSYVATVLAGPLEDGTEKYLARHLTRPAEDRGER